MTNPRQIAIALSLYADDHGSFPPAYVLGNDETPQHSWRVLLLPYLGHSDLFAEYDFDELWDGPNNSRLLSKRPEEYSCPVASDRQSEDLTSTHFVAVVGSRTVWPGRAGRKRDEISDDISKTVLIVEANAAGGIPWTKPEDLTLAEALPILASATPGRTGGHCRETPFTFQFAHRSVAMVNNEGRFLPGGIPPEIWRTLLIIDDGVPNSLDELERQDTAPPPRVIKPGVRAGLGLAMVAAPLSLILLWRMVLRASRK